MKDNYEELQCGQDPEDSRWSSLLTLWHGDVKTILRLRSVQAMRLQTSKRPYDSKAHVMPVMGLWHLKYNLLKLIHRLHFGGNRPIDQSCLQYAADKWDRTNANMVNDFQKLEELLIHSYQSRVLGLLLHESGRVFLRRDEAEEWITNMPMEEFVQRVNKVVQMINPPDFDHLDAPEPHNEQWYNHQCFIRHMDVYFLLRGAIKTADIGVLKEALRETCILFQAKEGRCDNYSPELLRLLHTSNSPAASNRLQQAIIRNSIVNLTGKSDRTFEVDRLVEFLNRLVSITKKNRANSTKPMETLLRQITLTAPYALKLKMTLEETFGRKYKGRHPLKEASEDIWLMATALCHDSFQEKDQQQWTAYLSTNLRREGLRSLGENVQKYNERLDLAIPSEDDMEQVDNTDQIDAEDSADGWNDADIGIDDVMESLLADIY